MELKNIIKYEELFVWTNLISNIADTLKF